MSRILNSEEPSDQAQEAWHQLGIDEVADRLSTSRDQGLSEEEAKRRLEQYGPNQLEEAPPTTFLQMLWEQFNNFVIYLLLGAALISGILNEWLEASAILAIVVLNAGFGIIQERRAEQALAALRKLAAPDAQVMRGGQRRTVPSREVVPGDIVFLEAGNYIPADLRLLEAVNLRIEEAALTGESVPVEKTAARLLQEDIPLGDRTNTAFMGTLVNYGRGRGIVVNTGMRTQIGLIAKMLQAVEEQPTPLQQRLDQLGRTLGIAALFICALVFVIGYWRGREPLDMFLIAVGLAIAAVPEGLPAVVTISLALGMREMIARNALIRRLSSVETLGSASVIGSDKTGTLTQNEMTVTRLWADGQFVEVTGSGYIPSGEFRVDGKPVDISNYPAIRTVLWVGTLNNDSILEPTGATETQKTFRVVGDPTEGSLLVAAAKADPDYTLLSESYPRVQEIPFDSERKRMTTLHEVATPTEDDLSPFSGDDLERRWHALAVKGAPDIILDLCSHYQKMDNSQAPLTQEVREQILKANHQMANDALRVLAMAFRLSEDLPDQITPEDVEKDLVFVGLQGMIDPPRPEISDSLNKARGAGIRTVMITGDYPETAEAIARQIGLIKNGDGKVLTGHDLNQMTDEQLQEEIRHTSVFARVSPEHKVRIVKALRANGNVVAMTGDGVNDAPALKQSDIGVAMGITGTDVAKETADMVLTDDNYASIVSAVEQGRVIYSNIRKFVFYLLSCNMAEIAIIFIATALGLPSPLNVIQLLWLNLITDGAPALALGTEKGDPDIMKQPPRPSTEPIINRKMRVEIGVQTVAIAGSTLLAYWLGLVIHPEPGAAFNTTAATMAFVTLSFSELFRAFTARSERYPLLRIGVFTNRNMTYAVMVSAVLVLTVIYIPFLNEIFDTIPLQWKHWQYVLPLLFVPSITAEVTKAIVMRKGSRTQAQTA
ncbi:MAG: cation-translocating P-type ATPase [Chloroflexi bacterium]|nr:cation-translocating P-type ATPase [Chloroflexota bacterium]